MILDESHCKIIRGKYFHVTMLLKFKHYENDTSVSYFKTSEPLSNLNKTMKFQIYL